MPAIVPVIISALQVSLVSWQAYPDLRTNRTSPNSPRMPNQIRDLRTVDKENFPYIFEQNASVPLKSSEGIVRLNVYRPKTEDKVPVLVTYGPYGKDIPYAESVLKTGLKPLHTSLLTQISASTRNLSQR
jgi:hypothetical protein